MKGVYKYVDFKSPESRALPIILKSEINKIWSGPRWRAMAWQEIAYSGRLSLRRP